MNESFISSIFIRALSWGFVHRQNRLTAQSFISSNRSYPHLVRCGMRVDLFVLRHSRLRHPPLVPAPPPLHRVSAFPTFEGVETLEKRSLDDGGPEVATPVATTVVAATVVATATWAAAIPRPLRARAGFRRAVRSQGVCGWRGWHGLRYLRHEPLHCANRRAARAVASPCCPRRRARSLPWPNAR